VRVFLAAAIAATQAVSAQVQGQPASSPPANESGTQFYARYLATVQKATTVAEVVAFWSADLAKQFNDAPPAYRTDLDGMKRIYSVVTSVEVVKETPTSMGATLSLQGVNRDKNKVSGTVDLFKENGVWRVAGLEGWKN